MYSLFARFFCILLSFGIHGQIFTFKSNCSSTAGDSVTLNDFQNGCIESWSPGSGNPSSRILDNLDVAVLKNGESIVLRKNFNTCIFYNFNCKIKIEKAENATLELSFRNGRGDHYILPYTLKSHYSSGWISLLTYGQLLPTDFEYLILSFKGAGNSLFFDEFSISQECEKEVLIEDKAITGQVQNKGTLTLLNGSVLNNDSAFLKSEERVILIGETILSSGSEVLVQISTCPQKPGNCVPETPKEFMIYNFLSPNGDGQNDTFYIDGLEQYPGTELAILNKAGKQVFHSSDYKNDWNGDQYPAGVYSYQIRLRQGEKPISGELLLTR